MNSPGKPEKGSEDSGAAQTRGPSLILLYSLIALVLAVAIACALLIVLPFYHAR